MENLKIQLVNILVFIKNNYIVITIFLIIFLLFIPLIFFNLPTPQKKEVAPSPIITQAQPAYPTSVPTITSYQEQTAKDSGPLYFSENSELATEGKKEQLSDGSIRYTFDSLNPNRSDVVIVKNGSIIFRRFAVVDKKTSDGYKNLLGKQSHILPGPTFYGPNTVIYFYQDGGTALTVDPKTQTTYEEFAFQPPISVEEFKQKYRDYAN